MNQPKVVSTEEQLQAKREAAARRKRDQRARDKAKGVIEKKQAKISYPAKEEKSMKSAKAIIAAEWGIEREHIIDTLYTWGARAAERLKIAQSDFYWANGPVATLKSQQTAENGAIEPLKKIEGDNIIKGEITYKRELFALYQFVEAWRQDAIATFEEYLAERLSCKVDGTINRGNRYFGKAFFEKPHARWDEMFIQWDPGDLKPDYTQEEAKKWLASQSEDKKRMLVACRNSYKSNFTLVYLVGAVLCCADIRLLLVSETRPLSRSFIQGFRDFFTTKNPHAPSRFNRLFAEYCIAPDDGSSLQFQSPMSRLGLFQPTANSTSMEAEGSWAGSRADIIVLDDPLSSNTVGTVDQREKSVAKYDAILELIEVGGYTHYNATPWHEDDLTAKILERNEKSEIKNLLYIIDPAWTVKNPEEGKRIWDLEEADVELLFPDRLTWKVLQGKLRDGDPAARTFRMQSLCMFLPEVEETQKLHFRSEDITRNRARFEDVPIGGRIVASSDLAFSKSRYADLTCFTIMRATEQYIYVLEQVSGHFNDTEKAVEIVKLYRKYPGLDTWLIENYPHHENLAEAIRREGLNYNVNVPVAWAAFDVRANAKFLRLKSIESVIGQNRIKFVYGAPGTSSGWIEELSNELVNLDETTPKRRSSTKKDDRGDSLSLGIRHFLPAEGEDEETKQEREEREEKALQQERMAAQYRAMFGTAPGQDYEVPRKPEVDEAPNNLAHTAIYRALQKGGFTKTPPKTLSFKDMQRPHSTL